MKEGLLTKNNILLKRLVLSYCKFSILEYTFWIKSCGNFTLNVSVTTWRGVGSSVYIHTVSVIGFCVDELFSLSVKPTKALYQKNTFLVIYFNITAVMVQWVNQKRFAIEITSYITCWWDNLTIFSQLDSWTIVVGWNKLHPIIH